MSDWSFAPAKVNLFLHVGPLGGDGLHPLSSLVAFADVGDRLRVRPAGRSQLRITGQFARALEQEDPEQNLIMRALALLRDMHPGLGHFQIDLDKAVPVAAGLGGGSADAAALLRLINQRQSLGLSEAELGALSGRLGSDGPMCVMSRPCLAVGTGTTLSPASGLPMIWAVLVNPARNLSTSSVYRAFDQDAVARADLPDLPSAFADAAALADFLATSTRNDLEGPASALAAEVGTTLETLRLQPEALLVRMSGSGATCFALCADETSATRLADRLAQARVNWWVRRCRLGGPWGDVAPEA